MDGLGLGVHRLRRVSILDGGGVPLSAPPLVGFDSSVYEKVISVDVGGGGDYTNLSQAQNAEAVLNSAKRVAFICTGGTDDFSNVNMSSGSWGSTPIEVWCESSYLIRRPFNLSGVSIKFFNLRQIGGVNFEVGITIASNSNVEFWNCRINRTNGNYATTIENSSGNVVLAVNSIFSVSGANRAFQAKAGTFSAYNCVFASSYTSSYGLDVWAACDVEVINCIGVGLFGGFTGTFSGRTLSNNASSGPFDTAPGDNGRSNQTFTFENAGAGDYRITLADAGARGYGLASGESFDYGFDFNDNPWNTPPSIGVNEPQE